MGALETAIESWHPVWVVLGVCIVALLYALYRLGLAYVNLVVQVTRQQAADVVVKQQLVKMLAALRKSIQEALRELE